MFNNLLKNIDTILYVYGLYRTIWTDWRIRIIFAFL